VQGRKWRDQLRTLDDAGAADAFRFRRDEHVATPRGAGRIQQGYDSGDFVGYDIVGDDGTLFMAEEKDIRHASDRQ